MGNHTEINTGGGNQSVHTSNHNYNHNSSNNNMGHSTLTTSTRGCGGEGYFADYQWSPDLATFIALPLTSLATLGNASWSLRISLFARYSTHLDNIPHSRLTIHPVNTLQDTLLTHPPNPQSRHILLTDPLFHSSPPSLPLFTTPSSTLTTPLPLSPLSVILQEACLGKGSMATSTPHHPFFHSSPPLLPLFTTPLPLSPLSVILQEACLGKGSRATSTCIPSSTYISTSTPHQWLIVALVPLVVVMVVAVVVAVAMAVAVAVVVVVTTTVVMLMVL